MNKEFIPGLTKLVEANLANELFGIEELAREMGMSHSNLHRKLKSSTNQTISQFIREIRLKKAKELLLSEDLTAAEISYRVGFGSPTYFNKCFHEYFGYAPGEMRNRESDQKPLEVPVDTRIKNPIRRKMWIVLIILSFFLIPLSYFLIHRFSNSNTEKSIAVLPFKYLSDEPGKQYLADGMMDAILTNLSHIKDIRVLSRTSVEQYRKSDKSAKVIGKELGVAYLLEGSLQKEGDKIRLIMQLIKIGEEGHAWANIYDRSWKDIFSVQSEVSETIVGELQAAFTPEEKKSIRKIPTTNITAYDLYLKAKANLEDYEKTRKEISYQTAVTFYKAALATDSTFAKAYTGLAIAYSDKYYNSTFFKENFLDTCFFLVNKALAFDNKLDEAYYFLAGLYFNKGEFEKALGNYDKAIEINPNYYMAYYVKGMLLSFAIHDFVQAIENFNKALTLIRGDERPSLIRRLGYAYLDCGFFEKAKYYYQQAFALDSNKLEYLNYLSWLEFCNENFEEAFRLTNQADGIDSTNQADLIVYSVPSGHNKEAYKQAKKIVAYYKKTGDLNFYQNHRIGYAFWQIGNTKEAEIYLKKQIKIDKETIKLNRRLPNNWAYYDLAATYAFLGDKVKAYHYLNEWNTLKSYPIWFVSLVKHDPLFESIRNEDQFQKVIQNVEAKYQTEHERVRKWLEEQKML